MLILIILFQLCNCSNFHHDECCCQFDNFSSYLNWTQLSHINCFYRHHLNPSKLLGVLQLVGELNCKDSLRKPFFFHTCLNYINGNYAILGHFSQLNRMSIHNNINISIEFIRNFSTNKIFPITRLNYSYFFPTIYLLTDPTVYCEYDIFAYILLTLSLLLPPIMMQIMIIRTVSLY